MRFVHKEKDILARGFTPLPVPPMADMPGFGLLVNLHREHNIRFGGLHALRTNVGWKFYRDPSVTGEFVSEPMLP